jgi:hypothetical protein
MPGYFLTIFVQSKKPVQIAAWLSGLTLWKLALAILSMKAGPIKFGSMQTAQEKSWAAWYMVLFIKPNKGELVAPN